MEEDENSNNPIVTEFNSKISGGSPIVSPITVSGDIPNGSIFNLQGKTVEDLTIDLTGLVSGETITLKNGSVKKLTIKDKSGVTFNMNAVTVTQKTTVQ